MNTFEAVTRIRDDHPAFPGHFPGTPVLPGAILAELVVESATEAGWAVVAIDALKFGRPITHGGMLEIRFRRQGSIAQFECTMDSTHVASGKLRIAEQ